MSRCARVANPFPPPASGRIVEEACGAIGRALHGVARPIFYQGEQVGETRHHDERLTMFLLRYRRASRYGAWLDHAAPPTHDGSPPGVDATAFQLEDHLNELDMLAEEERNQSGDEADGGEPASPRT